MTKIFVFGSNLAGRHGAGAAKYAREHYGAEYGVGFGPTGCAYAIPTKDYVLKTLTLAAIESFIKDFIEYAEAHPDDEFMMTPIGCGLAGYRRDQIKPLIEKYNRPSNVIYTKEWEDGDMNDKCECWTINHTFASFLSKFVERKSISECTSGGGYSQYTECKCKLCGRIWDEQ